MYIQLKLCAVTNTFPSRNTFIDPCCLIKNPHRYTSSMSKLTICFFFFSKQNIYVIKMSKKEAVEYFRQKISAKHTKNIEHILKRFNA